MRLVSAASLLCTALHLEFSPNELEGISEGCTCRARNATKPARNRSKLKYTIARAEDSVHKSERGANSRRFCIGRFGHNRFVPFLQRVVREELHAIVSHCPSVGMR